MCVRPAALVQGEADEQPDPEFLVPALLEAAQQQQVRAALDGLYDGTGACVDALARCNSCSRLGYQTSFPGVWPLLEVGCCVGGMRGG
jgi:hypothetical protein